MRSDPPWLGRALLGFSAASILLFAVLFRWLEPTVSCGLSLMPALTLATFGAAAIAWWGRRRGATLHLVGERGVVRMRQGEELFAWLDARGSKTFGAMVLEDASLGRRFFVFSQGPEPVVLIAGAALSMPEAWRSRTISVNASLLPVSSESAGVIELAHGATPQALLDTLVGSMEETPWVHQTLPSGETLTLTSEALTIGVRSFDVKKTTSKVISMQTPAGEVLGLSLTCDVDSALLACVDPTANGGTAEVDAPDAYLHPALFSALRTHFKST